MKVLYITARPPYPPHRGDQLIAFEQIRNIKNINYKIFLIALIYKENEKDPVINTLGKYCEQIYFIKINKTYSYFTMLKALINMKPIQVNMYNNVKLSKEINKILKAVKPDVLHVQTIRLAKLFENSKYPKVLDMIDILSLNMYRRSLKENFIIKQVLKFESILLKKYENEMINKFNVTSIVSKNDLAHSCINYKDNIVINPNGTSIIDKIIDKPYIKRENIILFHGNMSYFPNIEAMCTFITKVWPSIYEKYPDYKLYIVGKDPDDKINYYNGKNNIVVTGFVEDIVDYLLKAKVGIYPLNSGTGMQNKILEALACGLPSVASNYAIQGIGEISDSELLIANSKIEYIQAITNLLEDTNIREHYENRGREFIKNNYSWEKNISQLMKMWDRAYMEEVK